VSCGAAACQRCISRRSWRSLACFLIPNPGCASWNTCVLGAFGHLQLANEIACDWPCDPHLSEVSIAGRGTKICCFTFIHSSTIATKNSGISTEKWSYIKALCAHLLAACPYLLTPP
jgi:hypothetical protein